MVQTTHELPPGHIIDRQYSVVRTLGSGGIGVVYQVVHLRTGKWMALKLLHPHVRDTVSLHRLFAKEVRLLTWLSHPHIVSVFDCGVRRNGELYVTMEYLPGQSLEHVVQEGQHLSWQQVIEVGLQACHALQHAHQMGVFHRNLKPANVMLVPYDGEGLYIKLLDFGLTRVIEAACHASRLDELYAAPEVLSGDDPTPRTDVYGLGTVLYELLTGRPYQAYGDAPLFAMVDSSLATSTPIPQGLRRCICRALAQHPGDRYTSVIGFAEALDAILHPPAPTAEFASDDTLTPPHETTAFSIALPEAPPQDEQILTAHEWQRVYRQTLWMQGLRWVVALAVVVAALLLPRNQRDIHSPPDLHKSKAYTQEREPNERATQSTHIQLDRWIHGAIRGVNHLPNRPTDRDWFHFHNAKTQAYAIRVLPLEAVDLSLHLYQRIEGKGQSFQLREVAMSDNDGPGREERIPGITLKQGIYLLLLKATDKQETPQQDANYRFQVQRLKLPKDHEREPNDIHAQAQATTFDTTYTGRHDRLYDQDYFKFVLPTRQERRRRWKECPTCLPRDQRPRRFSKRWPGAPIYRLRFFPISQAKARISLLNAKGEVLPSIIQHSPANEHIDAGDNRRHPGIYASEKSAHTDVFFSGEGPVYCRVSTVEGFHYDATYEWRLVLRFQE